MIASRKALVVIAFVGALLALPWGGAVGTVSAQTLSVTSANPASGEQGTTNLDVTITGKGFKSGAGATFYKTRTTDPGGLKVNLTRYVSATQLVANIDIADTAALSSFDIQVLNADGRTGKGTELFKVVSKPPAQPAPKLTNVWSLQLPGELDHPESGIFSQDGKVFRSGSQDYGLFPCYNCSQDKTSKFTLMVWGSGGFPGDSWIGFRGITPQSGSDAPSCAFPSWDWDYLHLESLITTSPCLPGHLTGFLNHKHPQFPYQGATISLVIPNFDFTSMAYTNPEGPGIEKPGRLDVFVYPPGCDDAQSDLGLSGVGYLPDNALTYPVRLWRRPVGTQGDEWTIELDMPLVLTNLTYVEGVDRRGRVTCTSSIPQVVTTQHVKTTMVWTRIPQ